CLSSSRNLNNCNFEISVSLLKSWTGDNSGRRFLTCKFRFCKFFKWVDEEQIDWQRDVINQLLLEKKLLQCDNEILKAENLHMGDQMNKLKDEIVLLKAAKNFQMTNLVSCNESGGRSRISGIICHCVCFTNIFSI
ncbi:hypothetical protein RND81_13G003000, partial [Saponaria officinalis]